MVKTQLFYQMTQDRWTMLVFGFTRKAAMAFQEASIAAFNWMTDMIWQGVENLKAERNAAELEFMKEKDVASMGRSLPPDYLNEKYWAHMKCALYIKH
ncbi:Rha family transcriptional regulator [Pantoea sp. Lij88]|uniref:Rha family transcriptional regulator n=1 Tax=Pantoea sp. Lij88 TaxID=3028622 RepID=UPI0024BBC91B|nr:Rha family transcriptional regulator [Pantoea sp. Lij88]WHQ74635.1 hypothetical protein PU624_17765 [Pantoea sp. Lij88]